MEKVKISTIEKIKNILLVVLIFTTILLLYFLWGSESFEAFMFNDNTDHYEVLSSEKVIMPNQIILSRGNEDYTVAYLKKEELWNGQILKTFKNFSNGMNYVFEEITEKQYKEIMKYSSIIAKFEYDMPFVEFCEMYDIKQQQGYDNISNLTEIAFSKASEQSIFISDNSKKKFYRIVGNQNLKIFNEINNIFAQKNFTTYYTLKTFLGENSNNNTLIPVEFPQTILPIDYSKDINTTQNNTIGGMAQNYFGKTFDFVRKIEESNGTTIYMYGYGQKVLIINPNEDYIEYKAEIKSNASEPKSMFESLDAALIFIGKHGGFETLAGQNIEPYLKSVSYIDDKKDSYRFVFSFMVGKNKLFYEDQMPIIIDVVDGHISYFRRELINFNENQVEKRSDEIGISAINMLATNYQYMKDTLLTLEVLDKEKTKNISFENLADKIDNLYIGYLKPIRKLKNNELSDNKKQLIPVWVVEVNGTILYFDLYSGKPSGYSEKIDK